MKAFLAAIVVAAVLAGGTAYVLQGFQKPAATAFTTTGARLDARELGRELY